MRKKLHLFTFCFAGWPASRTRARTSPTSHNLIRSFDSSSGSCSTTSLKAYAKQASKSTSIQVSFFWHLLTIVKIAQNHPNPSRCTKVKCFMQWWYFWNATKNYSILNKAVKDDIFNQLKTFGAYRGPETQRNARSFWSSMAERQRFGCLDTWPCSCKQALSLRFPILKIYVVLP